MNISTPAISELARAAAKAWIRDRSPSARDQRMRKFQYVWGEMQLLKEKTAPDPLFNIYLGVWFGRSVWVRLNADHNLLI